MSDTDAAGRRRQIARGLGWTTAYQAFTTGLGFGAMLVLVRVIPPAEYGRYGVALGILALLNALSSGVFAAQALQLPEGGDPDWSLHWSAGLYIQAALALCCLVVAGLCWMVADYRPVAPLLHLGALGMLLDWPAQLRVVMLRRELDFRRLKLLLATAAVLGLATTLVVGLAGGGAYAIVLGSNVVQAAPFAVDLLVVRRWRPRVGWWRWPGWGAYRPAVGFGAQQAVAALLSRSRGAIEGLILPPAVGYTSIGLLNRARALFALTAERPGSILGEIGYPLLPRHAGDRVRYARHATLFAQALVLALMPGAAYVALEGPELSRLVYGARWVAADPLILPSALAGLGLGAAGIGASLLLACNRLRLCTMLEALNSLLALPAVALAWTGHGIVAYAWMAAGGQIVGAAAALAAASPLMARGWVRAVLLPPALSSVLAVGAVLAVRSAWPGPPEGASGLLLETAAYALALVAALRAFFPQVLTSVLSQAPGGDLLSGWLRLPRAPAAS